MCPEQDLYLGQCRMAVFEDCQANNANHAATMAGL